MAKLVWPVFCQQAVVDQFTNNLTIINQLDELHPPRPPKDAVTRTGDKKKTRLLASVQTTLVSIWERSVPSISEGSEFTADLIGPNREALAQFRGNLDFRKHRRSRQIGGIPALPLVGEGTYR